jgi:hypothetical protein
MIRNTRGEKNLRNYDGCMGKNFKKCGTPFTQ